MKGLQDVVDEEKKDWGEQLALLKDTVRALEDLESARNQIADLKAQIKALQDTIDELKTDEKATDKADEAESQEKKWRGGVSAALKEVQSNVTVTAICSMICVVLLLVSVGVSCWTWHRVNESTGNLYNLIQQR